MKLFVDTADVDDIRNLASTGLVDGVTTNPSLIAKSGRNFLEVIRRSASWWTVRSVPKLPRPTMRRCSPRPQTGRSAPNVAVKVPLTIDGLKTCKALADAGTKVNVTLCFSPGQVILANGAALLFRLGVSGWTI